MERSSDSQELEKKLSIRFWATSVFCFEIRAHLGHLFAQSPKVIKFNG